MVVSCDGSIRALNDAARAVFPFAELAPCLLTRCNNAGDELRGYLVRCSGSRQPVIQRLTVDDWAGPLDFRCLGSVLVPRQGAKPATVLLRLLPGIDARFTAGAERMRRITAEKRYRLALDRSNEAHDDWTRRAKQHRLVAEALQLVEGQKRALDVEIRRVRAEERERIAQDLHDQVGQELAMVIFELRRMRDASPPATRHRLDFIAHQLGDVGRRLHRAVIGGRPRIVEELGLAGAIERTVAAYAADGDLRHDFAAEGRRTQALPEIVENALYRVAQEALTNALKHATGARTLKVRLFFGKTSVSLSIADDGIGMPPAEERENTTGQGLCGMRRRMSGVGGRLDVSAGSGRGATVTATVPLDRTTMRERRA